MSESEYGRRISTDTIRCKSPVDSYSSLGSTSLRSLTHSLTRYARSFVRQLTSATPPLVASPVKSYGGDGRGRFLWGGTPPLVYRTKFPPLGGGTPLLVLRVQHHKLVLVFFSATVGGFTPPYWSIERSSVGGRNPPRRWGAVPPDKVTDDPRCRCIKPRQIECVQVLGVCDGQAV